MGVGVVLSTASLAGQLTDKRRLYTKILPNVQPWTRSSEEEEVCVCLCVCVCVCVSWHRAYHACLVAQDRQAW